MKKLFSNLRRRGFSQNDLPYTPIKPDWETFPIIVALREAEKETGITYIRTDPGKSKII